MADKKDDALKTGLLGGAGNPEFDKFLASLDDLGPLGDFFKAIFSLFTGNNLFGENEASPEALFNDLSKSLETAAGQENPKEAIQQTLDNFIEKNAEQLGISEAEKEAMKARVQTELDKAELDGTDWAKVSQDMKGLLKDDAPAGANPGQDASAIAASVTAGAAAGGPVGAAVGLATGAAAAVATQPGTPSDGAAGAGVSTQPGTPSDGAAGAGVSTQPGTPSDGAAGAGVAAEAGSAAPITQYYVPPFMQPVLAAISLFPELNQGSLSEGGGPFDHASSGQDAVAVDPKVDPTLQVTDPNADASKQLDNTNDATLTTSGNASP